METTRRSAILGGASAFGLAALGGLGASQAEASSSTLYSALQAIDNSMSGTMSVAVHDERNAKRLFYNPSFTNYCASIVKVLILTTVSYHAQQQNRNLTAQEQAVATKMIRNSDNSSATWLWNSVGGSSAVQDMAGRLGMTGTTAGSGGYWGLTQTTATDQLKLIDEIFYYGHILNSSKRAFIRDLMSTVESDQRWGVGSTPGNHALKNGWLQYPDPWIINSIGHTYGNGRNYTIAILESMPTEQAGINLANRIAQTVYTNLESLL